MAIWDAEAGKVNFEFAPSKFPPRKPAAGATARAGGAGAKTSVAIKLGAAHATSARLSVVKGSKVSNIPAKIAAAAKSAAPRKTAVKKASTAAGLKPSAALAAVIGAEAIARPQVIKKLWDYIKANGLQDAANKRNINADAKLLAVFGKPQVTMFELAGIVGKHLTAAASS